MSGNTVNASVARNTQISSTPVLTLAQTHVRMYYQGSLRAAPFVPDYAPGAKAGGKATFGDFVRAQHEYAATNLDTSTINARYMVVSPKSYGAAALRPLHVVTHNTARAEHSVTYNITPTDTAVDPEVFKTMTTAWRGLFANIGAFSNVTLDTLYLPLIERAFGCAMSILINAPPPNTQLDALEWRDPTTWTGAGGLLRVGPNNNDPLVTANQNTRVPIYLPTNMQVGTVDLGLTLFAVAQRGHFYAIPNNGNPFSNYYYETINPVTFLSSAPLPVAPLTQQNVLRALQQLAHVCDYLGVTNATFQLAASRCLRAGWVVPDLFTLPNVLAGGAMLGAGETILNLLNDAPRTAARLAAVVAPNLRPAQAWLRAQLELIVDHSVRAVDVLSSCDHNAIRILEHLHANPDPYILVETAHDQALARGAAARVAALVEEPPRVVPIDRPQLAPRNPEPIDEWNELTIRPTFRAQYTRPITFFGYTTEEPKYDWSTYLYLSLRQRLSADKLASTEMSIDRSWLPFFNLRFFGGAMMNFACMQNAAVNLAPATVASTRGLPNNCLDQNLANLDVDHQLYQRSATSGGMFGAALTSYQLAHLTHTVVPPGSVARIHALPAQLPEMFSEILITFVDPELALAIHGVWTPQCPVSKPGIDRLYPELRKPTLCYTNFVIDGVADLHTALARGGFMHGMSPQLTTVDVIDADGYANPTPNVALYTEAYLNQVRAVDQLIWRYVPNFHFDKFAAPNARAIIRTSTLVKGGTTYSNLPEIEFSGTPIMPITVVPITAAVSKFGQKVMSALLKCITVVVPADTPRSALAKDAMKKMHIVDNLPEVDLPNQLEMTPEIQSLVGSDTTLLPNDSASQVKGPADFQ